MSQDESQETMQARVRLAQTNDFQFTVTTDAPADWSMPMDEPPPIGDGDGPNAARLIASAVGHCLSASLLFCLQKSRAPIDEGVETTVDATIERNERGRWRIGALDVQIHLPEGADASERALERCLGMYEDFCIVTESVRNGIPVDVNVQSP